ncbi:hypothetical protein [Moorena producens]|uniref:hypothetical protein n=1 Tax=Moorena producens TaxID=1155739 RepID=UPI003C7694A4
MANINVNDLSALNMTGAELFKDSESFMTELSDESKQMEEIYGGIGCVLPSCQETLIGCWRNTAIKTIFVVNPGYKAFG